MKEDNYNITIGKSQESALSEKLVKDQIEKQKKQTREPELVFEPFQSINYIPSDPTGAAFHDHYVAAWNSSFRIFDKSGIPVISAASLASVFGNDELGDPIVLYDAQAERFILTSMGNSAVNFAITEGSNPYTDGWYVYTAADDTFSTGDLASDFPDYPKYSTF